MTPGGTTGRSRPSRSPCPPGRLEVEHVTPRAKGGADDESNLWLSCPLCNRHKSDRTHAVDPEPTAEVPLFYPRVLRWSERFRWSEDGLRISGLTTTGHATVEALHLDNDPDALVVRSYRVLAGWQPPAD